MKIALVTRDYNARGGVEKITQSYARILRSREHEVHVWCSESETAPEDEGISFHRIPLHCGRGWLYVLMFAIIAGAKLPVQDYDAVVVMGVSALCKDSFIVANSVHRRWFEYSLFKTAPLTLRWWLKLFNFRHYVVMLLEHLQYRPNHYRRVIAVSEPIKTELEQCYSVPPSLVDVLPNGADFAGLRPDPLRRDEVRRQLGVEEGEYLLCMLANEIERKGVRQALHALQTLQKHRVKLLIAGRLNREACLQLARASKIENRVIVRPSTPNVKDYLWASDLYVLPTQYEAWNLSIMEAHAAGLPVITTRLGQADLVVEHNESGFLLDNPLDVDELVRAIKQWIDCPEKLSMQRKARHRAEAYSWERIVDRLDELIKMPVHSDPVCHKS